MLLWFSLLYLANGYEINKTPYGEGVAFHNLDGLTRSICMALIRQASLLTDPEFRYIRSADMLLSQPTLDKLMGSTVSRVPFWNKPARCRSGPTSSCVCFISPKHRGMTRWPRQSSVSRPSRAW